MRDELRAAARLTHDPAFMRPALAGASGAGGVRAGPPSPPPRSTPTPSGPVTTRPAAAAPAAPAAAAAPDRRSATWSAPAPGPGRSRRTLWIAAGAAAAVAVAGGLTAGLLADGGGGDDPEPGPTTEAGFAEQSAEEILREAEKEMKVLDTVRLAGMVTSDDGQDFDLDMTISSRGDCTGTMGVGGGSAELLRVDGETWFKPDRGFWEAVAEGQDDAAIDLIVSLQGDDWVVVPPEDATDFENFCDLDELLEEDESSSSDASSCARTAPRSSTAQPVVKVVGEEPDGEVASYVSLSEPHYIVRIESPDGGAFDLSGFDEPLDAEAPDASDVTDLSSLE